MIFVTKHFTIFFSILSIGEFLLTQKDNRKKLECLFLGGLLGGLLSLLGLLGGLSSDSDTSDTTAGEGDVLEEGAEVSVVADGESEGAGGDALGALSDGLGSEFEGFGGQVLEGGSEEDGGAGGDALGEAALAEHAADTAGGEGEAGLVALGTALLGGLLGRGLARSSHVEKEFFLKLLREFVKPLFRFSLKKEIEKGFVPGSKFLILHSTSFFFFSIST